MYLWTYFFIRVYFVTHLIIPVFCYTREGINCADKLERRLLYNKNHYQVSRVFYQKTEYVITARFHKVLADTDFLISFPMNIPED
jgi:hypothetical protein